MTRNERIDAVLEAFDVRIHLPPEVVKYMTDSELIAVTEIADRYARAIRDDFIAYMENERNAPSLTVVK